MTSFLLCALRLRFKGNTVVYRTAILAAHALTS